MIRFVHLATAARIFAHMFAVHRIVFRFFLSPFQIFLITIFRCFTCFTWAQASNRCTLRTIHSLYEKHVSVHDTYTSRVPLIVTIFVHNFAQRLWVLIFFGIECGVCSYCSIAVAAVLRVPRQWPRQSISSVCAVHTVGPAGANCKQWHTNWKNSTWNFLCATRMKLTRYTCGHNMYLQDVSYSIAVCVWAEAKQW